MTTVTIPAGTSTYTISTSGVTGTLAPGLTRGGGSATRGVDITGNNDVLINSGTMTAGTDGAGPGGVVVSGTGVTITNQAGGYIHGAAGGVSGVYFSGVAGSGFGVVTNAGIIASGQGAGGNSGLGVVLDLGGSVTNLSTGTITGAGVYAKIAASTVVNSGVILGDSVYGAIYMTAGGTVTNLAGTIAANGAGYAV